MSGGRRRPVNVTPQSLFTSVHRLTGTCSNNLAVLLSINCSVEVRGKFYICLLFPAGYFECIGETCNARSERRVKTRKRCMESVDWAVNTDWKEIKMLEGVGVGGCK